MNHPTPKHRKKKTFHIVLVFTIAFLFPAMPVHATGEIGPYFTFTGSMAAFKGTSLEVEAGTAVGTNIGAGFDDTGLGFNHSIGYQFRNSLSTELEFSYKGRDFRGQVDGDMTSKSFLINGIYSFNIRKFYTPYIGYGVGFAFHEASIGSVGDRADSTLAYQLKMGVDMDFSRKISLLLGYRYFTTNNPKFDGYFTGEAASHGIETGIKFHF